MPQLIIPYEHHHLELDFDNSSLQLKLIPTQSSSELSYSFVTKLHPQNMDGLLNLLFNSVENIWTYINFYKEKSIVVDFGKIEASNQQLAKDFHANPLGNFEKIGADLPMSIKLIMLEGIGTVVKLKGDMTLESVEKRLAKTIEENKKLKTENHQFKTQINQLQQKLTTKQTRESQLQHENLELKRIIETHEKHSSNYINSGLPRKKIHVSEDHEEQKTNQIQFEKQEVWNQNGKNNLENSQKTQINQDIKKMNNSDITSNIGHASMIPQTTEKRKVPEPAKVSYNILQQSSQSPSNSSSLDERNDSAESNSSRKSKRSKRNEDNFEKPKVTETEYVKKPIELNRKENDTNSLERSFDQDYTEMNSFSMVHESSTLKPSPINNHKEKLLEGDKAKIISKFVEKCFVEVGYNEKGEAKTGFLCVFCEKVFKQSEFLNKHIFTRHPEAFESHMNEEFLMGKLNAYRMNREASVHAQIRNKKLEKALRFNPENRPLQ